METESVRNFHNSLLYWGWNWITWTLSTYLSSPECCKDTCFSSLPWSIQRSGDQKIWLSICWTALHFNTLSFWPEYIPISWGQNLVHLLFMVLCHTQGSDFGWTNSVSFSIDDSDIVSWMYPQSIINDGVVTIVHGTIVQGDSCPREFCPSTWMSKQTIVQSDFCPRSKFGKVNPAHIIFFLTI